MEQKWLDELREFIAIPSVSADPAHQDDLRRAAEWVRDFVKRAGGEAELVPKGRIVRLQCEARVDGKLVLDGEAVVSVPGRARAAPNHT